MFKKQKILALHENTRLSRCRFGPAKGDTCGLPKQASTTLQWVVRDWDLLFAQGKR